MTETRRLGAGSALGGAVAAIAAAVVVGDLRLLLVPVAAVVVVASFVKAEVGLFVLVGLEVSRASLVLEELHGVPSFIVPFSALVLVGAVVRRRPGDPVEPTVLVALALIAAYGLALVSGVFHADDPELVWSGGLALVKEVIAVLAILAVVRTGASLRVAMWAVILAGTALAVPNLYQHLAGDYDQTFGGFARGKFGETFGIQTSRIGGPLADPNYFAQTLVVAVALAIERAMRERAVLLRVVALGAAALTTVTVVATRSRGGWMALGVVAVVVAWRLRPKPSTIVALGAVVGLGLALGPASYRDGVRTLIDPLRGEETDGSLASRGHMVQIAGDMFVDHPVLGVGWRHYPEHFLDYAADRGLEVERRPRAPHTIVGEAAAEGGLVGLAALGALVGGALAVAARALRRVAEADADLVEGLLLGTVAFLVTALFLSLSSPQVFWLVLALCFATGSLPSRPAVPSERSERSEALRAAAQ